MKLAALVSTLILGTSSLAAARPAVYVEPAGAAPVVRDHRLDREPVFATAPALAASRLAWVALGEPRALGRGNLSLRLDDRRGFTQLRVQSARGRTRIDRVVIHYADGTRSRFDVDATLDAREPMLQLPVEAGRRIERITLKGTSLRGGAIQVFGLGRASAPPPVMPPPVVTPPPAPAPILLAPAVGFTNTLGSKEIILGRELAGISTLRLAGVTGAAHIERVRVVFAHGRTQDLAVGRALRAGETLDLDLGRPGFAGRDAIVAVVLVHAEGGGLIRHATGEVSLAAF